MIGMGFIIAICVCIISSQTSMPKPKNPPKLIVIGLDGASWNLLDPWMEQGILPNLQRIKKQGVSSTLTSMDPMSSPTLWTTICTGVSPEKHGVSGFFSTRADIQVPRIWDVMSAHGVRVGLFGWLLSHPPETQFAFCIPAWLARTPETHPKAYRFVQEMNLEQTLEGGQPCAVKSLWKASQNGARIGSIETLSRFYLPHYFEMDDETHLAKKMLAEVPMQTDVFLRLLYEHEPDVAAFTLYGTDKLGHRFWHYMQPESFSNHHFEPKPGFKNVIQDYYQAADQAVGRILQSVDENTTIVVLSDHGMKADPAMPRQFFLDTANLLRIMNLEQVFRHHTIMRQTFLEPINDNPLLLEETKSALSSFRFADGEPVFRVIIENGKIILRTDFSLTWNEESPLIANKNIQYAEQTIPTDELFFLRTFSGAHDLEGVLMMVGPHINQDIKIHNTPLVDIAPTLLFIMNQPRSHEMEGSIIADVFLPDWYNQQRVDYVDSYDNLSVDLPQQESHEALLERLRSMGYVE